MLSPDLNEVRVQRLTGFGMCNANLNEVRVHRYATNSEQKKIIPSGSIAARGRVSKMYETLSRRMDRKCHVEPISGLGKWREET
jgi:hypothetical protein